MPRTGGCTGQAEPHAPQNAQFFPAFLVAHPLPAACSQAEEGPGTLRTPARLRQESFRRAVSVPRLYGEHSRESGTPNPPGACQQPGLGAEREDASAAERRGSRGGR